MTLTTKIAVGMALVAGVAAAQQAPTLTTPKEKASYALGVDIGTTLTRESVDLDQALLVRGLQDALSGGKTLLTPEEVRAVLTEMQAELQKKHEAAQAQLAADNKKAGDAFLAENKAKEGVVTLPSGLQYKVLKAGEGAKPTADDTVVCHYRGMLIDGKEFDSSYSRNEPMTFPVSRIIKGWTEALQLMPVGSKWQLVLPPSLGYGERGTPGPIGPNATLVFEVELLSIKDKTAAAPAAAPAPTPKPAAVAAPKPAPKPALKPAPKPAPKPTQK
jgi:FKBP-type peptidyl-prolyl cis-trans isomerase FklB